jgi:hypothetical protein
MSPFLGSSRFLGRGALFSGCISSLLNGSFFTFFFFRFVPTVIRLLAVFFSFPFMTFASSSGGVLEEERGALSLHSSSEAPDPDESRRDLFRFRTRVSLPSLPVGTEASVSVSEQRAGFRKLEASSVETDASVFVASVLAAVETAGEPLF